MSPASPQAVLGLAGVIPSVGLGTLPWCAELSLRPGEILGLTGANGSGKSTLLRCIMGEAPLAAGSVSLEGRDLLRLAPEQRARAGIAYLPQFRNVFPSLTVAQNVWIAGRKPSRANTSPVRLPAHRRAGLLSGGERQLLAISMVFNRNARLYLLDEPFAGMAPEGAAWATEYIRDTVRELGAAAIVVEHRLGLLDRLCSRIVGMESWFLDEPAPE